MSVPWDVPRSGTGTTTSPVVPTNDTTPTLAESTTTPESSESANLKQLEIVRVLQPHNFEKALKEITPSSSESLGSLSALRKWNEEFGEGRVKKKKIMWGKGLFGFSEKEGVIVPDGRVSPIPSASSDPSLMSQVVDNWDRNHDFNGKR